MFRKRCRSFNTMGGGCRYGYYAELQEKTLKDLGYNCKVINLVTEGETNIKRINKLLKQINPKYSKIKTIYYSFITLKMVNIWTLLMTI